MQKDLKTGMIFGLALIAVAALWLSTRQSLSVKARMLEQQFADSQTQKKVTGNSEIHHKMPAPLYNQTQSSQENISTGKNIAAEQPRFTMSLPNISTDSAVVGIENKTQQPQTTTAIDESQPTAVDTNTQRFHLVRSGETLSGIAYKYYGSAAKWRKIHEANRKILKDADKLRPGSRLIIPQ